EPGTFFVSMRQQKAPTAEAAGASGLLGRLSSDLNKRRAGDLDHKVRERAVAFGRHKAGLSVPVVQEAAVPQVLSRPPLRRVVNARQGLKVPVEVLVPVVVSGGDVVVSEHGACLLGWGGEHGISLHGYGLRRLLSYNEYVSAR